MKKRASFVISLVVITGFFASGRLEAQTSKVARLAEFDITKEPKRSDWRYFHNAPERLRYELWSYHRKQGHTLGSWTWGWRLGWVRSCAGSTKVYCREILRAALLDEALVVRAEAATVLGRRYEDTGNKDIIAQLAKAFDQKENYRGGKPLFVVNRILFALYRIGGNDAHATGAKLASSHPASKEYWGKIYR